ncbi:MAG: hypothetical protein IJB07_05830, partial [Firmicutes bacterium]|nr:hypothetical protein [Bacillota bacterium]
RDFGTTEIPFPSRTGEHPKYFLIFLISLNSSIEMLVKITYSESSRVNAVRKVSQDGMSPVNEKLDFQGLRYNVASAAA